MALPFHRSFFTGNPLDRAALQRRDPAWLDARLLAPESLFLPFFEANPFVMPQGKTLQLGFMRQGFLKTDPQRQEVVFLGLGAKDVAHFGVSFQSEESLEALGPLKDVGRFEDLRNLAMEGALPRGDLSICAFARALILWAEKSRFCAACAEPMRAVEGGYKRLCEGCGEELFPRTDPVVIMLPVFGGKAFLARQKGFPPGFYSAPAGFVEPGESLEEAVLRELKEEADLSIQKISYVTAQPWPYPHSLMVGYLAEADSEAFHLDGEELEEGRWFSLEELSSMVAPSGLTSGKGVLRAPPAMAIAHDLIQSFLKSSAEKE